MSVLLFDAFAGPPLVQEVLDTLLIFSGLKCVLLGKPVKFLDPPPTSAIIVEGYFARLEVDSDPVSPVRELDLEVGS